MILLIGIFTMFGCDNDDVQRNLNGQYMGTFQIYFHPAVVSFHIHSGQVGKSGLGTLRRSRLAAPFHHAEQFHGIVVPGLDIGELWRDFGTDLFFLESGR